MATGLAAETFLEESGRGSRESTSLECLITHSTNEYEGWLKSHYTQIKILNMPLTAGYTVAVGCV